MDKIIVGCSNLGVHFHATLSVCPAGFPVGKTIPKCFLSSPYATTASERRSAKEKRVVTIQRGPETKSGHQKRNRESDHFSCEIPNFTKKISLKSPIGFPHIPREWPRSTLELAKIHHRSIARRADIRFSGRKRQLLCRSRQI